MIVLPRLGDRLDKELAGSRSFALLHQGLALVQHLVGPPLTLGDGGPGAIDIGAGARVRSIEEQDARPEMDGFFVPAVEVFVETLDEQRFDAAVPIGGVGLGHRVEASWISHQKSRGLYRPFRESTRGISVTVW